LNIAIEDVFLPFATAALERLRYLYPARRFQLLGSEIAVTDVTDDAEDTVRRDVAYQLYREKIYQEGLPMRQAMYSALLK
jgi:hypothetical protein